MYQFSEPIRRSSRLNKDLQLQEQSAPLLQNMSTINEDENLSGAAAPAPTATPAPTSTTAPNSTPALEKVDLIRRIEELTTRVESLQLKLAQQSRERANIMQGLPNTICSSGSSVTTLPSPFYGSQSSEYAMSTSAADLMCRISTSSTSTPQVNTTVPPTPTIHSNATLSQAAAYAPPTIQSNATLSQGAAYAPPTNEMGFQNISAGANNMNAYNSNGLSYPSSHQLLPVTTYAYTYQYSLPRMTPAITTYANSSPLQISQPTPTRPSFSVSNVTNEFMNPVSAAAPFTAYNAYPSTTEYLYTQTVPRTSSQQFSNQTHSASQDARLPAIVMPLPQQQHHLDSGLHQTQSQLQSENSLSYREYRRNLHDLPEFQGRPEEWPMFIATYRESTRAYGYTDLENVFRLQKSLKGEAREAVESLLIYHTNVETALEQLEFLYGRPEHLIRSQIMQIREIPPINDNQLERIIPFATKVRNLATFLQTTNSVQHLANPILLEELTNKLPMNKRIEWAQYSINIQPYSTVFDFSNWINHLARTIAKITLPPISTVPRNDARKGQNIARNRTVLHVTKNLQDSAFNVICSFCNESHFITACPEFLDLSVSDRWEQSKMKRLCFSCLKAGHSTFTCRTRRYCGIDSCRRSHHKLLHESDSSRKDSTPNAQSSTSVCPNEMPVLKIAKSPPTQKILFKIVPVKLLGPRKIVNSYALLDEGSSLTMIDEDLANDLELEPEATEAINLKWFGDVTEKRSSSIVTLDVRGYGVACNTLRLTNVRTIKGMQLPVQSIRIDEVRNRYRYLKNVPISEYSNAQPQILIGLDNCEIGMTRKYVEGNNNDPVVVKTKLGWVLYGPIEVPNSADENHVLINQKSQPYPADKHMNDLHDIVNDYFTTENFGVQSHKIVESEADVRARLILEATTVRKDKRYETGLLWRKDIVNLPNSYEMAMKRLLSIERKMQRDPEFAASYNSNIQQYIQKGYARKLTPEEAKTTTPRTWYLPHFGVKNPSKPDKLRLVFDAAAEVNGISLNSMLLTGPDQYQSLTNILYKFRLGAVAVCGDIKEMFHQVLIKKDDQDSQRFLWRNGDQSKPAEIYVMVAMTFGATCSPCSAQYVKNKNAEEFHDTHPKASQAIVENHYVDDYVASFDNEAEALAVTEDVRRIHEHGGFEIRNFVSNSKQIIDELNYGHLHTVDSAVDMNKAKQLSTTDKILGMHWDTQSDEFRFKLQFHRVHEEVLTQKRPPTKRELLSHAMSIFDPFGLLANFLIYTKLLIQDVWKTGIDWDAVIPDVYYIKWQLWQDELRNVNSFRIPRCYSPQLFNSEVQLHIFVDASESAFAAAAYLRMFSADGTIEVAFVAGKTKCAPKKLLSIPRLELQSAVLGTRLKTSILESHQLAIARCIFWSDSNTVIQWINSDHRQYKPFVAYRIAEILDSSEMKNWRWIPSRLNVADDATRAKYPPTFEAESRWIRGPDFLYHNEDTWPESSELLNVPCKEEMRCLQICTAELTEEAPFTTYLNRFSTYTAALKCTAWAKRYLFNYRRDKAQRRKGGLLVSEILEAELHLCATAQMADYPEEYVNLKQNKCVDKSSSIHQLSPFINEDSVIRIGGRIDMATCIPVFTRHPIILPRKHRLTVLIVDHYHRQLYHQNDGAIICEIRQKFWIPHVAKLVRNYRSQCQDCKIRASRPNPPMMGQLPTDRLTPFVRPFTYTGLDYFGPIYVTIGRRREKRWVALFTCLTIRAVHVELAADLSTDACIICIKNFINRRGIPKRIRSDNGTNFVGVDRELRDGIEMWNQDRISSTVAMKGIEWEFNCPATPHSGGCWERLVRCIKRVLQHTLKEVAPHVETLRSLLIEAENIVNSRPLTHIPVCSDEDDPLTPNHFLLGTMNSTQTPPIDDFKLIDLRKQWRISQQLKDCFWKRWIREYLPTLTRRTKWHQRIEPIKIGDLVIICDSDVCRSQWKRGRIINVCTAKDGQVRSADVKTTGGTLRRPATKLAVLDVFPQ